VSRKASHSPASSRSIKARASARERLRAAGLRATRPRTLVYTALREAGGHRSVDDVLELLERRGHVIPRMSIYNVMSDLTAASLVMSADVGPGRALYEASDVWHHHFVCRRCGRIDDVPCLAGRKPCLRPPEDLPGSTVDEAQVIFRGHCAACAAKAAAGKRA
jgi:Fur family ferric uptake transcriptional regulator